MPYSGVKGWQSYRFRTSIVCRNNQSIVQIIKYYFTRESIFPCLVSQNFANY